MSVLSAQVVIPAVSAIAKDAAVNTFHFGTLDPATDIATSALIAAAIGNMYQAVHTPGSQSMGSLLAGTHAPNLGRIKIYRLNDAKPRPALYDAAANLGTPSSPASMPGEVALCGSYQAEKLAGEIQARRRGRFYLGPLNNDAPQSPTNQYSTPNSGCVNAVLGAMIFLRDESDAAATWSWVVYSTVNGLADTAAVDNGWVDNAWDTQRRRGRTATTRTLWG